MRACSVVGMGRPVARVPSGALRGAAAFAFSTITVMAIAVGAWLGVGYLANYYSSGWVWLVAFSVPVAGLSGIGALAGALLGHGHRASLGFGIGYLVGGAGFLMLLVAFDVLMGETLPGLLGLFIQVAFSAALACSITGWIGSFAMGVCWRRASMVCLAFGIGAAIGAVVWLIPVVRGSHPIYVVAGALLAATIPGVTGGAAAGAIAHRSIATGASRPP